MAGGALCWLHFRSNPIEIYRAPNKKAEAFISTLACSRDNDDCDIFIAARANSNQKWQPLMAATGGYGELLWSRDSSVAAVGYIENCTPDGCGPDEWLAAYDFRRQIYFRPNRGAAKKRSQQIAQLLNSRGGYLASQNQSPPHAPTRSDRQNIEALVRDWAY